MEIKEIARSSITEDEVYDRTDSVIEFEGHRLDVNNIIIEEPGDNVKRDLLDFSVPEGEILLIYEKDHKSRDLVLYALTKNLPMFTDPAQFKTKNSTIRLGGISIKSIRRSRNTIFIQVGSPNSVSSLKRTSTSMEPSGKTSAGALPTTTTTRLPNTPLL